MSTSEPLLTARQIARVAHEVNRACCQASGDDSQPAWEDAPEWQVTSSLDNVIFHLANPDAGPSHSHVMWMAEKIASGWKLGPVKNPDLKEHPSLIPYDQLSPAEKMKDYLFCAVVRALGTL